MAKELRNQINKLPKDLTICIERAHGLIAADSNGKSDPYVRYYLGARPKNIKKASKTTVRKANLDPVWWHKTTLPYIAGAKLTLEVYDKDLIGKDDFLGQVVIDVDELLKRNVHIDDAHDKKKPFTLLPREGKKDKVKGTIVVAAELSGLGGATLGPTLSRYFCSTFNICMTYANLTFNENCYTVYRRLAKQQPNGELGLTLSGLLQLIKELIPAVVDEDTARKFFNTYDDSGDGTIDFLELMVFLRDMTKIGSGQIPVGKTAAAVAISEALRGGKVDRDALAGVLRTKMVLDYEQRDQDKLDDLVEKSTERMMKAMDLDGDGSVTPDELRHFCQNSDVFVEICLDFLAIPMKSD